MSFDAVGFEAWKARRIEKLAMPAVDLGDTGRGDFARELLRIAADNRARPVEAGMSDAAVCDLAARRAELMAEEVDRITANGPMLAELLADQVDTLARALGAQRAPMGRTLAGKLARARCKTWWARQLKRAVVLAREAQGRASGEVCGRRQAYMTDDTVRRMLNRDARARAMLESTEIEAQDGTVITLANASDASTANPVIRRGELMTRIKGCEEWADANGWRGIFTTNTTPSRFHATLHTGATNPRWVEAGQPTPKDGQGWLCKTWARCRSALARAGLEVFGFRVAEPHQDGTPHWHMLVFTRPGQRAEVARIMRRYWLADEGDEPGAKRHRFKAKSMQRGGAAGYCAKYISKGIDDEGDVAESGHYDDAPDGTKLVIRQQDMFAGGAARVRMWARAHGIRQFQAIGQPPVTVWRELRRVDGEEMPRATDRVLRMWDAVNRDGEKRASWGEYISRQGGACTGRRYLVEVATEKRERVGRYETEEKREPVGVLDRTDERAHITKSSRKEWKPRGTWQREAQQARPARAAQPWTRVNNCTQEEKPKPKWEPRAYDWRDVFPADLVREIEGAGADRGRNAGKNRPPSGGFSGESEMGARTGSHSRDGAGLCGTAVGCAGSHQRGIGSAHGRP